MKWTLLILSLCLTSASFASKGDPVVATVNGKKILKSTLLSYHQQNLNYVQNTKKISIENSLNDLVDRLIGIEQAKKAKIHLRPEVIKKMNDIVYHAYISEELTPKLKKIKVTDKMIKEYYSKYPEYKTSQILLRLRTNPSPEEYSKTMALANKIYGDAIKNVKSFPTLAKKYGQTTTALTGGDMGYQPKARVATEYYDAIKDKKPNSVTKPFRTQYGIHIVLVGAQKKYEQIDRKLYETILYNDAKTEVLKSYFAGKRAKAKLKINEKELK